jgi:hypothetical protein
MRSSSFARVQRRLTDPLNQGLVIDAWLVDHPRHRVRVQFQASSARQHGQDVLRLRELRI